MQEVQAELLPPEGEEQEGEVNLAPLRIETPLEQFKNLFNRLADIRSKVILWEQKTVIKDSKTRDQAIELRTTVTRTAKFIDDTRKALQKPVADYIKEMNQYATEATVALIGTKDDPALGVAGRLTTKISNYAAECKRLEEAMKAKALAEQKKLEDEIEARRIEADMKEQALRVLEEQRMAQLAEEAKKKAQAEGRDETDQMEADIALEQEQARIDAERAAREEAQRKQAIEDQKAKEAQQQKTVNTMAVATSVGKVKGVKDVWVIELVDEEKLDKKFMTFDPAKARKWLDGGFHDKKETDAEKIIPGLRCVLALGKGGR
jgi:hypothetical protein